MAVLKSIQRGSSTLTGASLQVTGLTSYDPEKTIMRLTSAVEDSRGFNCVVRIRPTTTTGSQTTFELDRNGTSANQTVYWELWEFTSGVTVQHINTTLAETVPGTYDTITCASRTTGSSFILASYVMTAEFFSGRQYFTIRYGSSTTILVESNFVAYDVFGGFSLQSIEWTGSSVQMLEFSISSSTSTDLSTSITAVTLANAIAIGAGNSPSVSPRLPSEVRYGHYFSDNTHLNIIRTTGTANSCDFKFFVINFGDGTVVADYNGSVATGAGASTTVTLTPNVNSSSSTAILRCTAAHHQLGGTTTADTTADSMLAWAYAVTISDTTVTLDRKSDQTAAGTYRLSVISFDTGVVPMPPPALKTGLPRDARRQIIPY